MRKDNLDQKENLHKEYAFKLKEYFIAYYQDLDKNPKLQKECESLLSYFYQKKDKYSWNDLRKAIDTLLQINPNNTITLMDERMVEIKEIEGNNNSIPNLYPNLAMPSAPLEDFNANLPSSNLEVQYPSSSFSAYNTHSNDFSHTMVEEEDKYPVIEEKVNHYLNPVPFYFLYRL